MTKMFNQVKFGDKFVTEHGNPYVYVGYFGNSTCGLSKEEQKKINWPFHKMIGENDYEICLYDDSGIGPYGFSVGGSTIFKPVKEDNLVVNVSRDAILKEGSQYVILNEVAESEDNC